MKDKNEHLNINLDFLDEKEPVRAKTINPSDINNQGRASKSARSSHKYNWKKIIIISIAVLFYPILILLGSLGGHDNSINSSSSNHGDTVRVGEYNCSLYDADQADLLTPEETEERILSYKNVLNQRLNELNSLKDQIDSSYVNEYSSQYEIDQYNELVDEYNLKLSSRKEDIDSVNSKVDRYNEQVDRYNSYLSNHCTKAY